MLINQIGRYDLVNVRENDPTFECNSLTLNSSLPYFKNTVRRTYKSMRKLGIGEYKARQIVWEIAFPFTVADSRFVSSSEKREAND